MEIFTIILILLASGGIVCLGILSLTKRKDTTAGRMRDPLMALGPRYRDGTITYNQFDGKRYNIELDIPEGQSARYQRRHARRQRKQAKPWEK